MKNIKKLTKWFTLVELIIVITILAILATIAFVSFQNYTKDARDSNRLANINAIEKWLNLYQIKAWSYPMPESYITITSSGSPIWYQWVFWENSSRATNFSKTPLDPLDNINYTYNVNTNLDAYQITWFFENSSNIAFENKLISKTYASSVDYSARIVKSFWKELWVLLINTGSDINRPLQEKYNTISFTWIDVKTYTWSLSDWTNIWDLKVVFNNKETDNITGTWINLIRLENIYKQKMQVVMMNCPSWWNDLWVAPSWSQSKCTNDWINFSDCHICEANNNSIMPSNTLILTKTWTCNNSNFIDIGYPIWSWWQAVKCDSVNRCMMCKSINNSTFLPWMVVLMQSCPTSWLDLWYTINSGAQMTKCLNWSYCKICQKN